MIKDLRDEAGGPFIITDEDGDRVSFYLGEGFIPHLIATGASGQTVVVNLPDEDRHALIVALGGTVAP